jgi:hypothetical protein
MSFKHSNRRESECEYGYSRCDSYNFSDSGQPIGFAAVVVFVRHTRCAPLELALQQEKGGCAWESLQSNRRNVEMSAVKFMKKKLGSEWRLHCRSLDPAEQFRMSRN